MKEISVILKNNLLVTIEEFSLLEKYSSSGRFWTLVQHPTVNTPFVVRVRTLEYIFDLESFTFFKIISDNVLATWDTNITRGLGPNDEFRLNDTLFIRPILGKSN